VGAAAGFAPRAPEPQPQAAAGKEIEPYSKHPSELKPYYVCPPPTRERPSCMAVGAPNPRKRAAAGLPLPDYEGSGVGGGFSPEDIRSAYHIPSEGGQGLTIAIVIGYDNPNAESDLKAFRSHYGLPECTSGNGCFQKVNEKGEEENYPTQSNVGWAVEASLDLDMASGTCPECNLLLVEAEPTWEGLGQAEDTAVELGAAAVSNSWGAYGDDSRYEEFDLEENVHYDHPGTPIIFSSGDRGYGLSWPSTSNSVIAVGGTSLSKDKSSRGWSETAWVGSGSGCSPFWEKPEWQTDPGCKHRTDVDVSAVSDPNTPVSVYDTYGFGGWLYAGGTSAAAPILAGVEANYSLAEREEGARLFWEKGPEGKLFDVAEGSNGHCPSEATYLCTARVGYDGPTGWGTPGGSLPAPPVVSTYFPSDVGISKATMNGAVNPDGEETTYRFEYGTSDAYGTSIPAPDGSVGSGSEPVEVSAELTDLTLGTTYHYRLVATNAEGTSYGADRTFAPSQWSMQYVPSSYSSTLAGISCAATESCIAVGEQFIPFGEGGATGVSYPFAAGWDGSEWATQSVPMPHEYGEGYSGSLMDVSCTAADACTAVGYWAEGATRPFAERWDGSEWTIQPVPEPSVGYGILYGVSCASSSSCVAVGRTLAEVTEGTYRPRGFSEIWDGAEWSIASIPHPTEAETSELDDVSCPSSTDCVSVGYSNQSFGVEARTLVEHWNGSEWAIQASPDVAGMQDKLKSVSCSSSSNCVAVGWTLPEEVEKGKGAETYRGLAELWNGSEWTVASSEEQLAGTQLHGVSCLGATYCLAVGGTELIEGETSEDEETGEIEETGDIPPQSVVEVWDGSEWSRQSSASPPGGDDGQNLVGVSCEANGCSAIGWYADWWGHHMLAERLTLPTPEEHPAAFNLGAGAPSATVFAEADPYEPVQYLQTDVGTLECEEFAGAHEGQGASSSTLELEEAQYDGCNLSGLSATVAFNGCHLRLHAGEATEAGAEGSLDVAGPSCEEEPIAFTAGSYCTLEIGPQSGLGPVQYSNVHPEGHEEEVAAQASAVEGLAYSWHGKCGSGSATDGTYEGTLRAWAEEAGGSGDRSEQLPLAVGEG
jgi:hypothetical protein